MVVTHTFRKLSRAAVWLGALGLGMSLPAAGRLWFDDYYQHPRDQEQYGQGVARGDAELRGLSNFYAPDATGIPNGTFVFAELIAEKWDTQVSDQPLSTALLEGVAGYMLVCPVREEMGGRANLTNREADILETFVAGGGSLVLVANSNPDPEKSGLDFAGLNLIGKRFGAEFQPTQTDTISVPIAPDHPVFDGVSDIIFGNGATIELAESALADAVVLMESHRPGAQGPVAVLIRHGQGKVLLLGDAGTLGNAHAFRGDTGHAKGLRQMMFALLPDGPMPHYGWSTGNSLHVEVREEQVVSGYPEFMEVFGFPHPDGAKVFSSGMRQIDLESSGGEERVASSKDFVSIVVERAGEFKLDIGAADPSSHDVEWRKGEEAMGARVMANGRLLEGETPRSREWLEWAPVLMNEVIAGPLRPYAQPGDEWTAQATVRWPQLQLSAVARHESAEVNYHFVGEADYAGIPCYRFKRVVKQDGSEWSLSDLVNAEYASHLESRGLNVQAGGMLTVSEFWIHRTTRLPVHTKVSSTATVWWEDPRFPAKYVGSHDSKNYENWETTNFVVTYGRVLEADFMVER